MSEPLKLTLPLPPNMANGSLAVAHWAKKKRLRDEYHTLCYVWRGENADRRPPAPLTRAVIRTTLYVHQTMDEDNLSARLKWAVDFLKLDGWIVDDSPTVLDWRPPAQVVDRKRPRVEIELEPA